MDQERARLLLESLIQRIERDHASGKWKLDGPLSDLEKDALTFAYSAIGGVTNSAIAESSRFVDVPKSRAAKLNLDSLKRDDPDNPEILLCLDFGTAMSKAAATKTLDEDLIELPLGSVAGDSASVFGLRSSLFISMSKRIFFGHEAISKSTSEADAGRKRFDSLKQRLSQGSLTDLADGLLDIAVNPTNVRFSQADAIVLYLAYLSDIATTTLVNSHGLSRYVRRRFARPCWEPKRAAWAEGELRKMLAKAQIVADTFRGRWVGGIPIDEAKATLDAVSDLERLPDYLIGESVQEPIAAGASRLVSEDSDRGLFVVVDVGAGTTDYAVFWANQDPEREMFKVWQIRGTVKALAQAGDSIDGYLASLILEKAHLKQGSTDYQFAATRLSLDIRQIKETLLRSGSVDVLLPNSTQIGVKKDDFLSCAAIQDFENLIRRQFLDVLDVVHESWFEELASFSKFGRDFITVVLTGGGSTLPMVKALSSGYVEIRGRKFSCRAAPDVPEWISNHYPLISPEYPQLAVAIGGAARHLPGLAPEASGISGIVGKHNWEIQTQYKTK